MIHKTEREDLGLVTGTPEVASVLIGETVLPGIMKNANNGMVGGHTSNNRHIHWMRRH